MTRFPILAERLTGDQALKVGCLDCGEMFQVANAAAWIVAVESFPCPACGSKHMESAYIEGERCRGCGKLALVEDLPLAGCCSRVCLLQAAYAEQLAQVRDRA